MKTLSLHQPWASLVSLRVKTIETRSWSTKYRGPLAIHAAKKQPPVLWANVFHGDGPDYLHPILEGDYEPVECSDGETWCYQWTGPLGAVVATCKLVACERTEYSATCIDVGEQGWAIQSIGHLPLIDPDQYPLGNFSAGRFVWLLTNIEAIDPVPAKGHQGLWEWEP